MIRSEDLKAAKKKAKEELLSSKIYHPDIQDYIQFNGKSFHKMVYSNYNEIKLYFLQHIKSIIKRSKLIRVENDKRKRPEILKVFRFKSSGVYKSKHYNIYIVVRQTRDGSFFYDYSAVQVDK